MRCPRSTRVLGCRRPWWRRARLRQGANPLGGTGPSLALFLRPTGLAAGLALKELRFLRGGGFAPTTGSPVPAGAAGEIRQASKIAAEYKPPSGASEKGRTGRRPLTSCAP